MQSLNGLSHVMEWFESCDRTQTYHGQRASISTRKFDCGVPQGPEQGPPKLIAYTEDLAALIDEHCLNHHNVMYADDTQMIEHTTIPGLVSAFVIDPLQRVQNGAARLVVGTGTRDHITPVLQSLHWLSIKFRIVYNL